MLKMIVNYINILALKILLLKPGMKCILDLNDYASNWRVGFEFVILWRGIKSLLVYIDLNNINTLTLKTVMLQDIHKFKIIVKIHFEHFSLI